MNDSRTSILRRLCRVTGLALSLAALALFFFVVACFVGKWDKVAAVTVLPFWIWATAGIALSLAGWIVSRRRFTGMICLVWIATLVIGSDETRGFLRLWRAPLTQEHPGEIEGRKVLRVLTLNCEKSSYASAREILPFSPDIVLLQEAPSTNYVRSLALELFGDEGSSVGGWHCAIIARGKLTHRFRRFEPRYTIASLELPDGRQMDITCLHLGSAPTRIDLWNRDAWILHRDRRVTRRNNLSMVLDGVRQHTRKEVPLLIGGDFNASPSDAIFRLMDDSWQDAWSGAGRGLGNTFSNRLPILRIDRLFTSPKLAPLRARTFRTKLSDHRLLVCDYTLE